MEKCNKIRALRADEIECRVAKVTEKGVSLLLYKDARVDQNILDEAFGLYNWKREHVFMGDALFCTVSVRDSDGNWVGKQDVGTPSYAEPVKGAASDAFKRACFNLGIGRELYTAPSIWIPAGKAGVEKEKDKYVAKGRFRVSKIGYDAKRAINELHIVDASGAEVYAYKAAKKDAADGAAEKAGSMGREPEKELRMELERTGISEEAVCSRYHVADISEIKGELYGRAMAALKKTKDAA